MKKDYNGNVIWINTESYSTLVGSFHELAQELKISIKEDGTERDIKSIVNDVYKYFAKIKSLFIFDDGEKYEDIKKFLPFNCLPPNAKSYFIITSRNQE